MTPLSALVILLATALAGPASADPQPFDASNSLDRAPHRVKVVDPIYPLSLRARGIGGIVVVEFIVDKNGAPQNVHAVTSPDDRLSEAA